MDTKNTYPFQSLHFFEHWFTETSSFAWSDAELMSLDQQIHNQKKLYVNDEIVKHLLSKNTLFASFAMSKAENSELTLLEAQEIYNRVQKNPADDPVRLKIKQGEALKRRDHDKLEFRNILTTFQKWNKKTITPQDLSEDVLIELHIDLTRDLDIFAPLHLVPDFSPYKTGKLRASDDIVVGEYEPPSHATIQEGLSALFAFIKTHPTPTGIAVFHTALYALHPFENGNKRICRVLEHVLLRGIGMNKRNLWSTSYYYHIVKERYYRKLFFSLNQKNFTTFPRFIHEAISYSIIGVLKTAIDVERSNWLEGQQVTQQERKSLKIFIKRRSAQFKAMIKWSEGLLSKQTIVTFIDRMLGRHILSKSAKGRNTFYRLLLDLPEYALYDELLPYLQQKNQFIPQVFLDELNPLA